MKRERKCPWCHEVVDLNTALDGSGEDPAPNDVAICFYCSGISIVFGSAELRQPTHEEMNLLFRIPSVRAAFDALQRTDKKDHH